MSWLSVPVQAAALLHCMLHVLDYRRLSSRLTLKLAPQFIAANV
jgi:hypothetical protein